MTQDTGKHINVIFYRPLFIYKSKQKDKNTAIARLHSNLRPRLAFVSRADLSRPA